MSIEDEEEEVADAEEHPDAEDAGEMEVDQDNS